MKAAMIQEKRVSSFLYITVLIIHVVVSSFNFDETILIMKDARERATQRKKQREENELKSSVVQVIRNTGKIKKMGKKQLRMIKKMDTTTMKTKVI